MNAVDLYGAASEEISRQEFEVSAFAVSADANEQTGNLAWELRRELISEMRRYRTAAYEALRRGEGDEYV